MKDTFWCCATYLPKLNNFKIINITHVILIITIVVDCKAL